MRANVFYSSGKDLNGSAVYLSTRRDTCCRRDSQSGRNDLSVLDRRMRRLTIVISWIERLFIDVIRRYD